MTQLLNALREKYASPAAVVRALGLDEALLREPKEEKPMTKTPMSEASAFLDRVRPLLAQDASIEDLLGLLDVLKAANAVGEPEPDGDETEDEDETPGGEHAAIDDDDEEDDPVEPNSALPAAAGEKEEKKMGDLSIGTDNEPVAKLREHLASRMSPEAMAEVEALLAAIGAPEAAKDEEPKPEDEAMKLAAKDEETKREDEKLKGAMDSAIKAAVKLARKSEQDIRKAERDVRPFVGELNMGFDSADQVYRHALKTLGVKDADMIHSSALPTLLEMQQKPGARKDRETRVAMDASSASDFDKMFPDASRIRLS
jgi:hypothetical protein